MKDWSAKQYLKFEDERTRPSHDLCQAIPLPDAKKIVDIGCGPANSTEVIAQHWPQAQISGFDISPDMIEKAKTRLPQYDFSVADVYKWTPDQDTDLVFSNAVFQWLPDHIQQMQRILNAMKTGAVLAVQMPDNLHEPTHRAMIEVAQDKRWVACIGHVHRDKLPDVSLYYDAFIDQCDKIDIWHTRYNHVMADHPAIVEWVKGTGLRPFIDSLSEDERADYLALYLDKIKACYPAQKDGRVLLPFPRIFMILVKK